jgi:hypothetical protein
MQRGGTVPDMAFEMFGLHALLLAPCNPAQAHADCLCTLCAIRACAIMEFVDSTFVCLRVHRIQPWDQWLDLVCRHCRHGMSHVLHAGRAWGGEHHLLSLVDSITVRGVESNTCHLCTGSGILC